MDLTRVSQRGLVLLGCGKMGSALLEGWLAGGLAPAAITVIEPNPGERLTTLRAEGLTLNGLLPPDPAVAVLAVKPQSIGDALPALAALGNGATLFVSIAAGTPIAAFEAALGTRTPIVRAMPNTPAAIGRGITALVGNAHADTAALDLAETLMGRGRQHRAARERIADGYGHRRIRVRSGVCVPPDRGAGRSRRSRGTARATNPN